VPHLPGSVAAGVVLALAQAGVQLGTWQTKGITTSAVPCKAIGMRVWRCLVVCVDLFLQGFLKKLN